MKLILTLLAAIVFSTVTATADPTKWDTLPDGRVVIEIFGQRLAFDPNENANQVRFEINKRLSSNALSLKQVLENRPMAEDYFNNQSRYDNGNRDVRLLFYANFDPNPKDKDKYKFLNQFDYADLLGPFRAAFAEITLEPPNQTHSHLFIAAERNEWEKKATDSTPNSDGIFEFRTTHIENKGTSVALEYLTKTYLVPASKRLSPAMKSNLAICTTSVGTIECYQHIQTDDETITIGHGWTLRDYPNNPILKFDDIFRKIGARIFIDRKLEDFQ